MPSPRRKRSRSRNKDDFKYPANSSKELKALLLQYLQTEKFTCPLDSITLMRNLRMQFKNPSGRMMMKSYNINDMLVELEDKKALKLEPFSLGTSKCLMVISYSKEIIQQLSRESSKDRPTKPPAVITDLNEKFPWITPNKSISNDLHYKSYKAECTSFCIKGTIKDIKSSDLILVNLLENGKNALQFAEAKGEEFQSEGALLIRDVDGSVWGETLEKWGYRVVGTIRVFKIKKSYMKRNLWMGVGNEEIIVGAKGVELALPEVIECESDQDLCKDILKVFKCLRPVEVFSKIGKDNWVIVESLNL